MGCTASNDTSDYLHQIEALRAQMEENKTKAHEQQNLLRFKVEVLVNMLAVEEKRSEETTKRIDTMQWLLAKQGINETSLNQILLNLDAGSQEKFHATVASAKLDDRILMPDVGTVVDKMRDEFTNNRDDILHAFCRADGKIVSTIKTDPFIRQLCEVTENLTIPDAKVLALRFDDGTGGFVSITEFIDFFVTPPSIRTARVAASAVRMSLDLFSLNVELLDNINEGDPDFLLNDEELQLLPPEMRKTHYTDILDRGAKRLLVMWSLVRDELNKQLSVFAKKNEVEKVIEVDIFENALELVCGPFSEFLDGLCRDGKITIKSKPNPLGYANNHDAKTSATDAKLVDTNSAKHTGRDSKSLGDKNKENKDVNLISPPPKSDSTNSSKAEAKQLKPSASDSLPESEKSSVIIEPLEKEDIAYLAERFELSGAIHYGYFLDFFENTHKRFLKYKRKFKNLPDEASGLSPFTYSSEWNALKASSMLRKSKDQIRMSRSVERKSEPLPTKVFTSPKLLVPKLEESPKETIVVIQESPTVIPNETKKDDVMETPKVESSQEKKEEATKEPVKKVEENKDEPKEEAKKEAQVDQKEVKKEEPPAPIKTAPVVSQSGCFLCSMGKSEPKTVEPPAIADSKPGATPPVKRDTPLHKQVTIDIDTPPEKESKDIADSKMDLPPIKRSESPRPFRVPKGFDSESTSSDDGGMLPHREGLGYGHNDDTPLVQPKPKGSRFRRRDEQDFSREKKIVEDPEEMEEDQRFVLDTVTSKN